MVSFSCEDGEFDWKPFANTFKFITLTWRNASLFIHFQQTVLRHSFRTTYKASASPFLQWRQSLGFATLQRRQSFGFLLVIDVLFAFWWGVFYFYLAGPELISSFQADRWHFFVTVGCCDVQGDVSGTMQTWAMSPERCRQSDVARAMLPELCRQSDSHCYVARAMSPERCQLDLLWVMVCLECLFIFKYAITTVKKYVQMPQFTITKCWPFYSFSAGSSSPIISDNIQSFGFTAFAMAKKLCLRHFTNIAKLRFFWGNRCSFHILMGRFLSLSCGAGIDFFISCRSVAFLRHSRMLRCPGRCFRNDANLGDVSRAMPTERCCQSDVARAISPERQPGLCCHGDVARAMPARAFVSHGLLGLLFIFQICQQHILKIRSN